MASETNYRFVSGPFEGSVVAEGAQILDVGFEALDEDLQLRIREWAEEKYQLSDSEQDFPVSLNQLACDYEASWESVETEEAVNLKPLSEW